MNENLKERLLRLRAGVEEANKAYFSHMRPKDMTPEEALEFDIEERKLCRAEVAARTLYREALDKL